PRFFCHAGASDWLPLLARNGWVPLFARDASCPLEVARSVSRRWRVCRAAPRSGSSARLAGGLEQGKAVLFLHGSGPADSLWPALRNAFVHRARFRCCLLYRGIRRPREATLLDASIPLARTVCCCLPRHRSPAQNLRPSANSGWIGLLVSRLTVITAIFGLCVLASLRPRIWQFAGFSALALVYFSFLYADTGWLNRLESNAETALAALPPGTRVIPTIVPPRDWRAQFIGHLAERACIGRCFAYSNYEAP